MEDYRNKTKKLQIGNVCIGGGERIAIQSMTNTKTEDVEACVAQILKLEKAGCDIIRVAVPTMEAAESIRKIKEQIHIPLVADIHFDYRLAIAAIENGADKIRINPGNIGDEKRVRAVVEKAKEYNIPIKFIKFNETNTLKKSDNEEIWIKSLKEELPNLNIKSYSPPGRCVGSSCGEFTKHYYHYEIETKEEKENFLKWKKEYEI